MELPKVRSKKVMLEYLLRGHVMVISLMIYRTWQTDEPARSGVAFEYRSCHGVLFIALGLEPTRTSYCRC